MGTAPAAQRPFTAGRPHLCTPRYTISLRPLNCFRPLGDLAPEWGGPCRRRLSVGDTQMQMQAQWQRGTPPDGRACTGAHVATTRPGPQLRRKRHAAQRPHVHNHHPANQPAVGCGARCHPGSALRQAELWPQVRRHGGRRGAAACYATQRRCRVARGGGRAVGGAAGSRQRHTEGGRGAPEGTTRVERHARDTQRLSTPSRHATPSDSTAWAPSGGGG